MVGWSGDLRLKDSSRDSLLLSPKTFPPPLLSVPHKGRSNVVGSAGRTPVGVWVRGG